MRVAVVMVVTGPSLGLLLCLPQREKSQTSWILFDDTISTFLAKGSGQKTLKHPELLDAAADAHIVEIKVDQPADLG